MSDLLSKGLGSKSSAEGSGAPDPSQNETSNIPNVSLTKGKTGSNMLDQVKQKVETAATEKTESAEAKGQDGSKVEPTVVADPDSWTKESALKEMKKAREEAKLTRLKYEESVQKLSTDAEARISAVKAEQEELRKAADELNKLKADQEDKKRDLTEKVAHREAVNIQLKAQLEATQKEANERFARMEAELARHRAEAEAQTVVYQQRLSQELSSIPEKFKELAQVMVKGAGDPRDALVLINEAKLKGMFEDKTTVVVHNVPGAHDGARATDARINAGKDAERSKLSNAQKIKEGLNGMKSGTGNSAIGRWK